MLNDVALLGADTARTRAYLSALGDNGLLPSAIVLLRQQASAGPCNIESAAVAAGIPLRIVEAETVNAAPVVDAVAALTQSIVVFSGPGGAIVREPLFATGKQFLHVHPGRLPDFRGSTTIYYSLLAENQVEATAILLDRSIDTGPVVGRGSFDPPSDRTTIDREFDPRIRAELLVSVLRGYAQHGRFETVAQPASGGGTYYIIHPVLKHIAILAP